MFQFQVPVIIKEEEEEVATTLVVTEVGAEDMAPMVEGDPAMAEADMEEVNFFR